MLKLYKNGIIIQKKDKNEKGYYGIDGLQKDNWYLTFGIFKENIDKYIDEYYFKYIDNIYFFDDRYIGCCNDLDYIKTYIQESKKINIKYRILFCETTQKKPFFKEYKKLHLKFLGYDYAQPCPSYASCIPYEINREDIPELYNIKLNKYGLFDTEKDVLNFKKLRDNLQNKEELGLELGDFFIYKLSEVLNIENLF